MARNFDDANAPALSWASIFNPNNQSYSISLWTKPLAGANTGYIAANFDGSFGFFLRRDGTDNTKYTFGQDGGTSITSGAGTVTEGSWQNLVATMDITGTDTGAIYKNGSSLVSSALAACTTSTQPFAVGNRTIDVARGYDGDIADVAAWINYVLTADQITMLAAGYSALFIRPLPTIYRALVRTDAGPLCIGPATTTAGTVGVADHPRIIYPRSGQTRKWIAPVGGGAFTLAGDAGSYAATGTAASLRATRRLDALPAGAV